MLLMSQLPCDRQGPGDCVAGLEAGRRAWLTWRPPQHVSWGQLKQEEPCKPWISGCFAELRPHLLPLTVGQRTRSLSSCRGRGTEEVLVVLGHLDTKLA